MACSVPGILALFVVIVASIASIASVALPKWNTFDVDNTSLTFIDDRLSLLPPNFVQAKVVVGLWGFCIKSDSLELIGESSPKCLPWFTSETLRAIATKVQPDQSDVINSEESIMFGSVCNLRDSEAISLNLLLSDSFVTETCDNIGKISFALGVLTPCLAVLALIFIFMALLCCKPRSCWIIVVIVLLSVATLSSVITLILWSKQTSGLQGSVSYDISFYLQIASPILFSIVVVFLQCHRRRGYAAAAASRSTHNNLDAAGESVRFMTPPGSPKLNDDSYYLSQRSPSDARGGGSSAPVLLSSQEEIRPVSFLVSAPEATTSFSSNASGGRYPNDHII